MANDMGRLKELITKKTKDGTVVRGEVLLFKYIHPGFWTLWDINCGFWGSIDWQEKANEYQLVPDDNLSISCLREIVAVMERLNEVAKMSSTTLVNHGSTGINVEFNKKSGTLRFYGWYDTCVGIEGEEVSLGKFCRDLGITLKMVARALEDVK